MTELQGTLLAAVVVFSPVLLLMGLKIYHIIRWSEWLHASGIHMWQTMDNSNYRRYCLKCGKTQTNVQWIEWVDD